MRRGGRHQYSPGPTATAVHPFLSAEKLLGARLRGVVGHYPHRCSLKHLGRSRSRTPTAASSRQWNTAKTDVFSRLHLAEEPGTSDAPGRASNKNRGRYAPPLLLGLQTMPRQDLLEKVPDGNETCILVKGPGATKAATQPK